VIFFKSIVRTLLRAAKEHGTGGQFSVANALALAVDHYAFARQRASAPTSTDLTSAGQKVLTEVSEQGFAAIEDFVSKDDCEKLRRVLTQRLAENPDLLHPATQYDLRLHGIENVDEIFASYATDPRLVQMASAYLQRPARAAFTLGASLQALEGNPGSGGGWHRDSLTPQFKTMLYLTDVGLDNGPFQILARSHHLVQTIRDNRAAHLPYGQVRFTQKQVDEVLENSHRDRVHTLHYPAGTLLIFDSSTIHRGSPIKSGTRLALTNYFYPESQIDSELYRHFQPVAGHRQ
jgi:Phytanoyl-CoA dioxygenase (PhyH)